MPKNLILHELSKIHGELTLLHVTKIRLEMVSERFRYFLAQLQDDLGRLRLQFFAEMNALRESFWTNRDPAHFRWRNTDLMLQKSLTNLPNNVQR